MNIKINVFYKDNVQIILEILEQDFKDFLADYFKKYVKQ